MLKYLKILRCDTMTCVATKNKPTQPVAAPRHIESEGSRVCASEDWRA